MASVSRPADTPGRRGSSTLVIAGIVVLAFNLRPAAVSVGPVLDEITSSLAMSHTLAGVLTALPVVAFAAFGAAAPAAARLLGAHRLTFAALLAVVAGLGLRPWTSNIALFLALSLTALAGMATANVLLPSLIKLHFPDRIGRMTALYTTSMAVGLTFSSILTVPISRQFSPDGWRFGLVTWALTALVAALPWLGLLRHDTRPAEAPHRWRLADVARTRLGWAMAALFGLQSFQAYSVFGWFAQLYRDAGFSASTAGLLLGAITGMSIPLSLAIPSLAARMGEPTRLMVALMACYPVAYVGLLVAPAGGALVWAVLLGTGLSTFPLVLTLIGLRARTPEGTAALSGFTQSVGYLIAVIGPFTIGALYDASGGWELPLWLLIALCVPQVLVGIYASRTRYVEDELVSRTDARTSGD
jgi:MFS transporter, CP family, cyanate transporter